MSDNFLALIDPMATESDAQERAIRVRERLVAAGLVYPELSGDCALGGAAHPPGPRLREMYAPRAGEPQVAESRTGGVEILAERWVNQLAFPVLEAATCPECGASFVEELFEPLGQAMLMFLDSAAIDAVECPSCSAAVPATNWTIRPHLGFCHLAVVFWNWPPFESPGWRDSVPDLVAEALGNRVIRSYGRL